MQKISFFMLIMLLIQLTACATSKSATPPTKDFPATSFTTTPKKITPTLPPTSTQTNSCWNPLPTIPAGAIVPGKLVLSTSPGLSIFDFQQHKIHPETDKFVENASTSPNGEWLSYFYSSKGKKLIIESAEGQAKADVSAGESWLTIFNGMPWLDNERLWISTWPDITKGQVAPVEIINPFTGEQQEILSNYPGLERSVVGPTYDPRLHFGYSSVVYNPSLQLVVYPEASGYITLWDRQSQKALVKLEDPATFENPAPLWLPDGQRFVVVAKRDIDHPGEWYMVGQNGNVRQLTHLQETYSKNFEIGMYARVSPDGNYLAFGLAQDSKPKKLFILNLTTLELINTCVLFPDGPAPIWSPDGKYISVLSVNSDGSPFSVVVLQLEDKWVANISSDLKSEVVGWLK